MLTVLLIFNLLGFSPVDPDKLYRVSSAEVKFLSDAPLELIQAKSDRLLGLIDMESKEFAFRLPVSSFQGFNSPLQREHFNENYMETGKYPYAEFHGKLVGDQEGSESKAVGKLTIHGISIHRELKVKLVQNGKTIKVETQFEVPLNEFDIRIPAIVRYKIAEVITVNISATLVRK